MKNLSGNVRDWRKTVVKNVVKAIQPLILAWKIQFFSDVIFYCLELNNY